MSTSICINQSRDKARCWWEVAMHRLVSSIIWWSAWRHRARNQRQQVAEVKWLAVAVADINCERLLKSRQHNHWCVMYPRRVEQVITHTARVQDNQRRWDCPDDLECLQPIAYNKGSVALIFQDITKERTKDGIFLNNQY